MSQIDDLPPLREIIEAHDLSAKKSLGQNFLRDLNLTQKIARSAGDLSSLCVVEIGPGPGGLTRGILSLAPRKVIVIERDERCQPILDMIGNAYPDKLDVVFADALDYSFHDLPSDQKYCLIANLPYNISTPLLTTWLETEVWPPWYEHMTLMFQREVAERICARPHSKAYGRLSILAQWRCDVEISFHVPPEAFTPAPKVMSSIVHFKPKQAPLPCHLEDLVYVTAAAFGQRRKMLRASLKQLNMPVTELLENAGIEGEARAEALSVEDFVRLANCYTDLKQT